jgi:hypothetical protein
MTTTELAQILLMSSRVSDLARATPAEAGRLALIVTQAVQEYFALAPACHRRTTLSASRLAPETVPVTVENGSATVAGSPFLARQRGCSIRFPDGQWNEITSPSTLLHSATQPSGEYECTVYNDALAFDDFQIDRVMTDPEITTNGGSNWLLSPWTPAGARSVSRPTVLDLLLTDERIAHRSHEINSWPSHYWAEHVGGSIAVADDALFQFRFWPKPSEPYQVTFDAEILPDTYRINDLTTPATLPVPDGHAQRILVPLAEGKLARSPLFDPEKGNLSGVMDAYREAQSAATLLPAIFAPNHVAVTTEAGW